MAPEQAETGSIDGRADIYSLGVIFYEMLTGMKPFYADSAVDVMVQHKRAPIPTLPTGLEKYQALLNLMLAKHRKDRFRDAESLLHYVRHLLQSGTLKTERDVARAPEIEVSESHPERYTTTRHRRSRCPKRRARATRFIGYAGGSALPLSDTSRSTMRSPRWTSPAMPSRPHRRPLGAPLLFCPRSRARLPRRPLD
jgi:serine/threonine protein kinase